VSKKQNNRSEDKARSSATVFTDYARYYDLLYRDKDYAVEGDYVAGLIKKYHPVAQSILELGSGAGIHANLLAKKGFTVHGIERSPETLASLNSFERRSKLHSFFTCDSRGGLPVFSTGHK
jgi:hypothetical protein